jgi:undecaprenyl-diphosphatase
VSRREWLRAAETEWLRRLAQAHERRNPVRLAMLTATRLADGWGLAILIPAAFILQGKSGGAAAVGLGTISAVSLAIAVQGTKALVRRKRPMGIDLSRPITAPDKHAFPSGHTAQAFGMVLIAWLVAPWLGLATLFIAVLVALSRLFFGLHYPTDVVVGAGYGLSVSWLCIWLCERWGVTEWLGGLL